MPCFPCGHQFIHRRPCPLLCTATLSQVRGPCMCVSHGALCSSISATQPCELDACRRAPFLLFHKMAHVFLSPKLRCLASSHTQKFCWAVHWHLFILQIQFGGKGTCLNLEPPKTYDRFVPHFLRKLGLPSS